MKPPVPTWPPAPCPQRLRKSWRLVLLLLPPSAAGLQAPLSLTPLLAVGARLWWLRRPSRSASIGR